MSEDDAKKAVEDTAKKYWSKKDDPSQDYRTTLQIEKDTVDLAKVGYINTSHPKHVLYTLLDQCKRYGIAQAKLDKISNREDMLCIRDMLPDIDFVNAVREKITKREWVQPRQELDYGRFGGYYYADQDQAVYEYCEASKNRHKVAILYGIKNLKYDESVGGIQANAAGSKAEINCSSAKITKSHDGKFVKVLEIRDLSLINDEGLIWFDTPFLFKRGDDMTFWLRPKTESLGKTDNLMLLGMIIEPLGQTVVG